MHYLSDVIRQIDKTHPHLGNVCAVTMLAIKAKKMLLIVSPRGCGKSRVTSFVGMQCPQHSLQDRLSVAALGRLQDEFRGFQGVIIVDDIAKTQTAYARITTITTLAELVYSHYCISHLQGADYEITDFAGSAVVNIQPVLLREIVKSAEWEASMMDKSIRYYHLHRPQEPNPLPPTLELQWGVSIDEVEVPELKGKLADKLCNIGEAEWGLARLKEHLIALLRASASLDDRRVVNTTDYRLLIKLLTPLMLETIICDKIEFESKRYLNSNTLAVLTEFVTYGQFTLRQIARDFKLSEGRCYQILNKMQGDWQIVAKNPTIYAPTEELVNKLKGVGIL